MSTEAKPQKPAKATPQTAEDDGYSARVAAIRAKRKERGVQNMAGYRLKQDPSKEDPRFVYRWVNEENVQMRRSEATFLGDYEFVPNTDSILDDGRNVEQGAKIGRICDRGTGKRTFWMRKPKELYDDDQRIKAEKRLETAKQMQRRGAQTVPKLAGTGDDAEDSSQIYTPQDVTRAYRP